MRSLRAQRRTSNHKFRKPEILVGNIGYVDLRESATAADGGSTAAAAMQFLGNTDALIFDLRENGGGRDLVCFLMSYLFDEPTHVHTARHCDHDEQTRTCGYVPGRRFPPRCTGHGQGERSAIQPPSGDQARVQLSPPIGAAPPGFVRPQRVR